MSEKENAKFTLAVLCVVLVIFILAEFFTGEQVFSDQELRLLATSPELSVESFLNGSFQEQYDSAVTDQFPGRTKLVDMRVRLDILLGKDEFHGVYLGDDDYLLAVHMPGDYPETLRQEKLAELKKFAEDWDAAVMLVPTAGTILADKLPFGAFMLDETAFLEEAKDAVGEDALIDVAAVLEEHKEEELYYRTDSHWTSLGAYYGYRAWADWKKLYAHAYDTGDMITVSAQFRGDLYERFPMTEASDSIRIFPDSVGDRIYITYDNAGTATAFYEESYLAGRDQYGYFLDGNHGLAKIETGSRNGKTLLLVKGSYGNAFVPLLRYHYQTIYVIDPEYNDGGLEEFMKEHGKGSRTDVLVLYDCIGFLEHFSYEGGR